MSLSDILVSVRDTFSRIYGLLRLWATNAMTNAGTNRHTELREEEYERVTITSVPVSPIAQPETESGANSVAVSPIAQPETGTSTSAAPAASAAATAASAASAPAAAVPENNVADVPVTAAAFAATILPASAIAFAAAVPDKPLTYADIIRAVNAYHMIKYILGFSPENQIDFTRFLVYAEYVGRNVTPDDAFNPCPHDNINVFGYLYNDFRLGDHCAHLVVGKTVFLYHPNQGICLNPIIPLSRPEYMSRPNLDAAWKEANHNRRINWTGKYSDGNFFESADAKRPAPNATSSARGVPINEIDRRYRRPQNTEKLSVAESVPKGVAEWVAQKWAASPAGGGGGSPHAWNAENPTWMFLSRLALADKAVAAWADKAVAAHASPVGRGGGGGGVGGNSPPADYYTARLDALRARAASLSAAGGGGGGGSASEGSNAAASSGGGGGGGGGSATESPA